ncbi:MAG: MraY family glycosyltransferase [Phycisphaerae bacterium]
MNPLASFWQMALLLMIPSVVGSFLLCWLMRFLSPKIGYVDRPAGRKAHSRVTPMGGGIAIFLTFAFLILLGVYLAATDKITRLSSFTWLGVHEPGVWTRFNQIGGILLGGLILVVLGLFDDLKNFGPYFKLFIQFAVAALVVIGFDIHLSLFVRVPAFGWIISILWLVTLTNAFNFLDNADGLSSGVALICAMVLLGVSIVAGQVLVTAFLACFAGTLIGFLAHNFPPAKIFLGDAGSLLIGYLLGVGTLLTTYYNQLNPATSETAVLIPLVVMAIPLYDFLSVIWLRWRSGVSPFVGDHRHFSHRLLKRGLTPRQMVLTIYLATVGTAVGAFMLRHLTGLPAILIFVQTLCIVAIIGILEYQPTKNGNSS